MPKESGLNKKLCPRQVKCHVGLVNLVAQLPDEAGKKIHRIGHIVLPELVMEVHSEPSRFLFISAEICSCSALHAHTGKWLEVKLSQVHTTVLIFLGARVLLDDVRGCA